MSERQPLSVLDSMFLWGERPSTMFHVAGLLLFTPPPDTSATMLRDVVESALASQTISSPWNRRLRNSWLLASPNQAWVTDENVDLEYHLRRSALPAPGGERELGVLVSRLHSHQLDFTRPPWEMHFIEGLEDGRFAVYFKVHHALQDGYSGMQNLVRSLSRTADEEKPLFFEMPPPTRPPREAVEKVTPLAGLATLGREAGRQTSSALTLAKRVVDPLLRGGAYPDLVSNLAAPRTILNRRIGRNRRFATQQYDLGQLKAIGAAHGATVNDVFLAVAGGGLRRFLSELDELPEKPLIAFLPVNVRASNDVGGGNAVGAILVSLGTHIEDPFERLAHIVASSRAAKGQLQGMTQEAILLYSAYLMAPLVRQSFSALTGLSSPLPLSFNVCISNVPGPDYELFMRGSRLQAPFPVSIPLHGMALNITVQSYAGTLCVGFVGDRDALPHLQHLAVYTGEELERLSAVRS